MTIYTPDRWVVIESTIEGEVIRRIVSGWCGGYLDSDVWRISSSIATVDEHDDRYEFTTHTGRQYTCHKQKHGFTGLSANAFASFKNKQSTEWQIATIFGGSDD